MTLINLSLLLGLGLAAIPFVLHLMMKAKPKKIEFPALRLLQARRTSNARRLRLRHLLLLLLRTIILIAVVLALARPSLPPARYGLRWWEWLLLGAVIGGALGVYRWLSQRASRAESGSLLRDRRALLRAWTLLGGAAAALLCVGIPWGLRVNAEITSPRSDAAEDIPVAAVFIVDSSVSMTYRHESRTRLEQAQRIATDHLAILPRGSRVAVSGTGPEDDVVFQADLAGAQSRIEAIKTQPQADKLNRIIRRAIEAQQEDRKLVRMEMGSGESGDLFAREIYILTDMAKTAWQLPDESHLRDLFLEHSGLHVYLVDVSIPNPVNMSLNQLRLSEESTVAGRSVELSVAVTATKAAKRSATVEVFLLDEDGRETRVSAPEHVTLDATSPVVTFPVSAAEMIGDQKGVVRISSSDPLSADDTRFFAFGVRPKPSVLLIADRDEEAQYLYRALQPVGSDLTGGAHFRCTVIPTAQFHQQELSRFDVVCLLNCRQPDDSLWASLRDYVDDGGALLSVLGGPKNLVPASWRTTESREVLAALPVRNIAFHREPRGFRLIDGHPMLRAFEEYPPAKTELLRVVVNQCWTVDRLPGARVVMHLSGDPDYPALIERSVGNGRSAVLTTAMYYDPRQESKQWNDFPTSWTFVMLADQLMQYLTGAFDQRHNYISGMPVEIRVPADQRFAEYRLQRPEFRQSTGQLSVDQSSVLIDDASDPGHYLLRSFPDQSFRSVFAVNLNDAETDLTPITAETLDEVLGKDRYSSVNNPEELERAVRVGRLGVEVFPVLLGLLILLFCAEHLMANFFYDEDPRAVVTPAA